MIAHLVRGFGEDGMWYEGENYHLFALRGQLIAMGWAGPAGVDRPGRFASRRPTRRGAAGAGRHGAPRLHLPGPQGFAVRRLAGPADVSRALGGRSRAAGRRRLGALGLARPSSTDASRRPAQTFDSYLHEAGEPGTVDPRAFGPLVVVPARDGAVAAAGRRQAVAARLDAPRQPGPGDPARRSALRQPRVRHLRRRPRPPRPAASHATRGWSALARRSGHRLVRAPRSLLVSLHPGPQRAAARRHVAAPENAHCLAFGEEGAWAWARGEFGRLTRTLVTGPEYLLDILEFGGEESHLVELPWHPAGTVEVETPGQWSPATLEDDFVSDVARFTPSARRPGRAPRRHRRPARTLDAASACSTVTCCGPRRRGFRGRVRATFYLVRRQSRAARFIAVAASGAASRTVRAVGVNGDVIEVEPAAGKDRHVAGMTGGTSPAAAEPCKLRGTPPPAEERRAADRSRPRRARAGHRASFAPILDGRWNRSSRSLSTTKISIAEARSRIPGPEEFSATAAAATGTKDVLYLRVDVVKAEPVFRPAGRSAAPARQRARRHPQRRRPGLPASRRRRVRSMASWSCLGRRRARSSASPAPWARSGDLRWWKGVGAERTTVTRLALTVAIAGCGAAPGRRAWLRSHRERDAARPHPARRTAGLERWRWLGVPPRRPPGSLEASASWSWQ